MPSLQRQAMRDDDTMRKWMNDTFGADTHAAETFFASIEKSIESLTYESLISDDDDETSENTEINDASRSSSTTTRSVRGIGIDLEFIDIKRGKRIKKRVLTENEQNELGQLEVRDTRTP